MNLSIIRTTASGKESLNIKDASEGIAYAVLRRFLPEQKDALTPDPIQVKVQQTHKEAAATDTTGIEPFRVPLDEVKEADFKVDTSEIFCAITVKCGDKANRFSSNEIRVNILGGRYRETEVEYSWADTYEKRRDVAQSLFNQMSMRWQKMTIGVPANLPLDTAVELPGNPETEPAEKERARSIIKSAQEEARKQFQEVSHELKDKLVEKEEAPADGGTIYREPTVIRKGGKDLYTVKVHCDACGHNGSRLTTENNFYVKCRACDNKLAVDQMYNTPFMANSEGYAFKADTTFVPFDDEKEMVVHGTDH